MPVLLNIVRIFLLVLVLLQISGKQGKSYVDYSFNHPIVTLDLDSATKVGVGDESGLYHSEQLQIPAAVLPAATSFQFGFAAFFCFLVLFVFSQCPTNQGREVKSRGSSSYFRNLFSTLILINAP